MAQRIPKKQFLSFLKRDYGIDIEGVINDIKRYLHAFDEQKFREAFYFAAKAHDGQFRKENKPYIVHPLEAVRILVSMHADEDTLIATLLHDVPEDTFRTIEDIEVKFGKKIAFLVEGITKLSKVHFQHHMAERQIESLKKLFIHSAEDPRIILIKLADRLHNMRTLQYLDKPDKQLRIARETLEIFVPIANLLGIEELKSELEDLCFRFLMPNEFEVLSEKVKKSNERMKHFVEKTIESIQTYLDHGRIKATVYQRKKNLYGIYKKLQEQGKPLEDFADTITLRILVPERDDCYKVLGIIHHLFKPKPSRFKDYIAVPKVNGYQSLHTTVFGLNGILSEFQIRTNTMHLEAEYGIAAHYFDDEEKRTPSIFGKDKRSFWVEKILDMQKHETANDTFLEELKLDILQERIFVFTPKGDPIDLPKDASCIDFAYSIHSDIGHKALKAEVNGKIAPMTTVLQTGDTVRIITADRPKEPNPDWLPFVKTNFARNKIREFLKDESQDARVKLGKKILQREFHRAGLGLIKDIPARKIRLFLKRDNEGNYKTFNDVLAAVGEGSLSPFEVVKSLFLQPDTSKEYSYYAKNLTHTAVAVKIVLEPSQCEQIPHILKLISNLGIQMLGLRSRFSKWENGLVLHAALQVKDFEQLSLLFSYLEQSPGVKSVERLFGKRKVVFTIFSIFMFALWAVHPYLLYFSKRFLEANTNSLAGDITLYVSLGMLFMLVFFLKRLVQRSFPELRETNTLWGMTLVLSVFVLVTFFMELFFFQLEYDWYIGLIAVLMTIGYLVLEYVDYKDSYYSA